MQPPVATVSLASTLRQSRSRAWLLSLSLLNLLPWLRADQPWGIVYNERLYGGTGLAAGGYDNYDLRKSHESNPLLGPYGVPQSPLYVQDGTALSSAGGTYAVASYSLATQPGLYWGDFSAAVGYGSPAANSASANFNSGFGLGPHFGSPTLGSRDEFVVTSATLPADTTVTLRETLTLAFDAVVHNNTPSPVYGTLPVQYTISLDDVFDGNNPISVSFDQSSSSGQASVSFSYTVQVGHRYTFAPQFHVFTHAESNHTAQTPTDVGYDIVMAGSASFVFPDSNAAALSNSGADYGQNNLPAAYGMAVPEPADCAVAFGGLSLLGAIFHRRLTGRR